MDLWKGVVLDVLGRVGVKQKLPLSLSLFSTASGLVAPSASASPLGESPAAATASSVVVPSTHCGKESWGPVGALEPVFQAAVGTVGWLP